MPDPATPLGRFTWHEAMTTDLAAARDFYTRLIGWGTSHWESEGNPPYEMWMNGEAPVGGLMGLPAPDVPPCWLTYVSTPDLDATLDRITALGGSVLHRQQVDEVGRFAVFADPQGGVIALLEPETYAPGHDGGPQVGEFSWHELATTDADAGWAFYREVFGWEDAGANDMGEMGTYQMFSAGTHPLGGIFNAPQGAPAGWLPYVRVTDIHAAAASVADMGGRILHGPLEVPGGDFVVHCMDAQGAAFALHATACDEEGEEGK